MSRDERTYGKIRQQYDAWTADGGRSAERHRLRGDNSSSSTPTAGFEGMSRTVHAAIGIGIGVLLLALAGYAFSTAAYWGGFGRDGAQVGYALTGFFLLVAGVGGIIATWNHNFRVLTREGGGGH